MLNHTDSPHALDMTIRRHDRDVTTDPQSLIDAFPDATGDAVVFVHGLCEADASWRLGGQKHYGDAHSTHGARLQAATGTTPVYLRYNTGLHISDNGAELDRLLADLVANWPVSITRLTLVGHSMGGLVIRSACHLDDTADRRWSPLVKRIVYLGAP